MNFFEKIKKSIYSPDFYASVPESSFWKAFRYLLLLFFILAVLQTIIMSLAVKNIEKELGTLLTNTVNSYPEELQVELKDGKVSTNVSEPYFIPLPEGDNWEEENIKNLIVIDTKTPFSAPQFNVYESAAWVTKDAVYYKRDSARIEAFDLSQIQEDFVLNKSFVETLGGTIRPYLKYVTPVLIVATFIGTFAGFEMKLLYLLLLALGILLLGKVMKWGLSYAHSYKVGMYAITAGVLTEFVLSAADQYLQIPRLPFLFTVMTIVVVYVNLRAYQAREEVIPKPREDAAPKPPVTTKKS
jgi:hypothetical protein